MGVSKTRGTSSFTISKQEEISFTISKHEEISKQNYWVDTVELSPRLNIEWPIIMLPFCFNFKFFYIKKEFQEFQFWTSLIVILSIDWTAKVLVTKYNKIQKSKQTRQANDK